MWQSVESSVGLGGPVSFVPRSVGRLDYGKCGERSVLDSNFDLDAIQRAIADAGFDGWLFYDFRGSDPIARKILQLSQDVVSTRRWFYYIPSVGEPIRIVHAIEPTKLDALPGEAEIYVSWSSLQETIDRVLHGARRIAMQYSPRNEVPYISRVDAGTVELIRSCDVQVVSSADLVQQFDATLTDTQLESHRRAAKILRSLVDELFDSIRSATIDGEHQTERSLLDWLLRRLHDHDLVFDHEPIVAVNVHTADPHFTVSESASSAIAEGDLVLVDVWAKERALGSIYADITWTAFVGREVPAEIDGVFQVVRDARRTVVDEIGEAVRHGRPIRGHELDRVARDFIERAGYGEFFIHRTGHSIHEEGHGNGANLDDLETHDTRRILPRTLFSVEPGIYLPQRFGIRSEVDVYHAGDHIEVTGEPHQNVLLPLLAD